MQHYQDWTREITLFKNFRKHYQQRHFERAQENNLFRKPLRVELTAYFTVLFNICE